MLVLVSSNAATFYKNFDVRVGTENYAEVDFPNYQQFGFFPGPSSAGQEIIFSYDTPVMAQYIVVQRMSEPGICPSGGLSIHRCGLQICHIEIR